MVLRVTPRLHQRHPELTESMHHVPLGTGPTPVRRLAGLERGGAELWLKDDGAFGDGGWGGNKVRKLEWILPEAERRRARTILTFGGLGTNWGLATALYGRDRGLAHRADAARPARRRPRAAPSSERLKASGAALHYTHTKARTAAVDAVADGPPQRRRAPALPPAGRRLVGGGIDGLRGGRVRDRRPGRGRASCPRRHTW